ncbi:MAG: SDR family oxidoreductase [Planctomycetes bacterium]|nr:SDR family oxidoreductase [Planctomycetota bacterium]
MFQSDLLAGKVIVITGGGTGLGKSMALRFAELGAKLVLTSRRQEVIDEAKAEIEAAGGEALAVTCDVRDFPQVEAMMEAAVEHFGRVDCLVNNAAGNFLCPSEKLSPNAFASVLGIVLQGSFHCALAFGHHVIARGGKESGGGNVISITTTYATHGSAYVLPSACAKSGVLTMTKSLAVEWAKYGIRVNAIAPGPFPTEGAWAKLMPPGMDELLSPDKIPARRFGEHHELANLAAYLLADGSAYLTGREITIDGGESLMAGEFNSLTLMDPAAVEQIMELMRAGGKK